MRRGMGCQPKKQRRCEWKKNHHQPEPSDYGVCKYHAPKSKSHKSQVPSRIRPPPPEQNQPTMSTTTSATAPEPVAPESQKKTDETIAALEAMNEFDHGVDAFSGDGIHGPGNKVFPPKAKKNSPTLAPALSPAEDQKAEEAISYLEAVNEFDHGVDAFNDDGIHHGRSDHQPTPQVNLPHLPQIKPKELLVKAEHAVEGLIQSVGDKMESAKKGAAAGEGQVREKVEKHTAEETAAGTMCVNKDIHKESFEAPQ